MNIEQQAQVVREYGPFGEGGAHGVTFDGKLVWVARDNELVAFDPETEEVVRRLPVAAANAGTAFDGEHLYQLAQAEILVIRPSDGTVVRKMPAPGKGEDSGMAYADGYLWIGQYRASKIHQVDAITGEVVKTLASDRWVTGVSCFGGAVWHGTAGGGVACDGSAPSETPRSELRRLACDGSVEQTSLLPDGVTVSGVEAAGDGRFWCGGGADGKVRLVRP
jgi:outer membrane protein assembly factor BamB